MITRKHLNINTPYAEEPYLTYYDDDYGDPYIIANDNTAKNFNDKRKYYIVWDDGNPFAIEYEDYLDVVELYGLIKKQEV